MRQWPAEMAKLTEFGWATVQLADQYVTVIAGSKYFSNYVQQRSGKHSLPQ